MTEPFPITLLIIQIPLNSEIMVLTANIRSIRFLVTQLIDGRLSRYTHTIAERSNIGSQSADKGEGPNKVKRAIKSR